MKQWSSWRSAVAAVLALSISDSLAQQWKAELPVLEKTGVYRIVLSPEMVGRSKESLGDVRLVDSAGTEVPYVFDMAKASGSKNAYHDFRITRNDVVGKETLIELERPTSDFIVDDIHLRIRNAQVQKEVTLTGSDDGTQWFFIKKDILLLNGDDKGRTSGMRMIRLPASDYAHYRLTINDSATSPIQVLSAQWFSYGRTAGEYTTHKGVRYTVTDSAGETRIALRSAYPLVIDRMEYAVLDTARYHRSGRLVQWALRSTGRGSKRRIWREEVVVRNFELSSDEFAVIDLGGLRLDTFDIVLDNGDDKPLLFSDLRFQQLQRSMIADLRPDMGYHVTTGDPKKSAPQYDIVHFKDKLPEPIATISHGPLIALAATPEMGPSIAPSRWWIWAGLVAVLGIVGFMAVRMLREPQQPNG